jgi:hypothetical protein
VLDTLLRDVARVAPPLRHALDRFTPHPKALALSVSNVAGPPERPSVLGAPVVAFYTVAEVDQRHGPRVAVISMADQLHFGVCADPAIAGALDPSSAGSWPKASRLSSAELTERGRRAGTLTRGGAAGPPRP